MSLEDAGAHGEHLYRWLELLASGRLTMLQEDPAPCDPADACGVLPRWYADGSLSTATLGFMGGDSMGNVPVLPPACADEQDPHAVRWFEDIAGNDLHLPSRAGVITHALPMPWLNDSRARVCIDGTISYTPVTPIVMPQTLASAIYPTQIRVPSPEAILRELFRQAGWEMSITVNGRYQEATITKLGGLRECWRTLITDPFAFSVMQLSVDGSTNETGVHSRGALSRGRRYLDLGSVLAVFQRLNGGQADDLREPVAALIDRLVTATVLNRGLLLKCQRCSGLDWYPLEDVGSDFACTRCREAQPICRSAYAFSSRRAEEPEWYYRVDEMVHQFWTHHIWVTTAALAKLQEERPRGFAYVPEIEVTRGKAAVQLDLMCIQGGRVIIGEAKGPDAISDTKQIGGYRTVARARSKQTGSCSPRPPLSGARLPSRSSASWASPYRPSGQTCAIWRDWRHWRPMGGRGRL